jgi:hypothetical protein
MTKCVATQCGVARIIYRQSDRSAYGYVASYQCGHTVEFHKVCAKDVNCHIVVHEYKYSATHRHFLRRVFLSFVRVCALHCNTDDCYC